MQKGLTTRNRPFWWRAIRHLHPLLAMRARRTRRRGEKKSDACCPNFPGLLYFTGPPHPLDVIISSSKGLTDDAEEEEENNPSGPAGVKSGALPGANAAFQAVAGPPAFLNPEVRAWLLIANELVSDYSDLTVARETVCRDSCTSLA